MYESASVVGDETMEEVADEEAMATGDEEKRFNDERLTHMENENTGHVVIIEDLKKSVNEKKILKRAYAVRFWRYSNKTKEKNS